MFLNSLLAALVITFGATGRTPVPVPAMHDGLPSALPAAVGMSAERLDEIDEAVTRGIRAGAYPGAAVIVGRQGYEVVDAGLGHLSWSSRSPAVDPERTIYDLASLTKVVATTTAIMILYDEGKIRLDDPVRRYLPSFSGGLKNRVTIRMLLEHRSGLPADRELWRTAHSPAQARRQVIATHLYSRPGARYIYSDLGADVLGFIVERVSGEPLDRFVAERVFEPLGMHDTEFRPAASLDARIAPTNPKLPPGAVNDANARALGSVAGHAGLFSTASDLAIFAQMMLNGGTYDGVRILSDSAVKLFTTRAPHAGTRALGWDTCDGDGSCGQFLGAEAYGHTGFTGTSMWIDPERQMFVILLTNRVYAPRVRHSELAITDVRADISDAAVLAVQDLPDGPIAMPAGWRTDRQWGWNRTIRHRHRTRPRRTSSKSVKRGG